MKNQFLEAGQIVNTHGIQGEVKIVPWCDTPEFLCQFDTLYLDGKPVKVRAARVHKGNVLATLDGDVRKDEFLHGDISEERLREIVHEYYGQISRLLEES